MSELELLTREPMVRISLGAAWYVQASTRFDTIFRDQSKAYIYYPGAPPTSTRSYIGESVTQSTPALPPGF